MNRDEVESRHQGLDQALQQHARTFRTRFGDAGDVKLFFSPGRVNLFGAHLDYNGGPVVPTAIDRGTFFALRRRADTRVRLASLLDDETFEGDVRSLPAKRSGRWFDYPLGALVALVDSGVEAFCGIDLLFGGNLPVGAGLSSSASICVGTAWALDWAWNLQLDSMQKVRCALQAEREFVGVQCGIMDPFAVGLARPGHLLWLDCKDETWEHLALDFSRVAIGVADTGVRRELADVAFNQRVAECAEAFRLLSAHAPAAQCLRDVPLDVLERHGGQLPAAVRKRSQHVLHEVVRTFEARAALERGDFVRLGQLMTETHASLRDLFEVSCPELDVLVDATSRAPGGLGARLTGAGFGGCIVLLAEQGAEEEVREGVSRAFEGEFGRSAPMQFFQGDEGPRAIEVN